MARSSLVRSSLVISVVVGAAIAGSPAARAEVVWRGDFSTGDLSQWSSREAVSSDRLAVVADPLGAHREVLKATVVQGDDPIDSSGNRNELLYTGDTLDGQERWYHWQTLWPDDYASEPTWQVFTQWHQTDAGGGGSPPVEFFVNGEKLNLRVQLDDPEGAVWQAPLVRGRWHDFVFHVKWSHDPSVGYVELWYDGALAVAKHPCATLFGDDAAYLKQGLYRSDTISPTQTIFHAGMTVGTTLDDVVPPPPQTPSDRPAASPGAGTTDADGIAPARAGCDEAGWTMAALPLALGLLLARRRRRG